MGVDDSHDFRFLARRLVQIVRNQINHVRKHRHVLSVKKRFHDACRDEDDVRLGHAAKALVLFRSLRMATHEMHVDAEMLMEFVHLPTEQVGNARTEQQDFHSLGHRTVSRAPLLV